MEIMKISTWMRKILQVGLCLYAVLFLSRMVEAADHPAFQPVKELFAAMSKHDGKAMQETSTEDFQLLEHGEDWTMQELVDAVQPKGNPYVRKNFFNQIRARQKGDMAWVSHWNKPLPVGIGNLVIGATGCPSNPHLPVDTSDAVATDPDSPLVIPFNEDSSLSVECCTLSRDVTLWGQTSSD